MLGSDRRKVACVLVMHTALWSPQLRWCRGDGQHTCTTFRNSMRSVRSGGGAETTTADEARRMEGAR